MIFFLAIIAETNRSPFDLVEAEQELVGGFHTEYSGMRFAMYQLAEYCNIFSMSAICATLFLGGWNGPTFDGSIPAFISAILPTVWFLLKTYAIIFVFFWIQGDDAPAALRPVDATRVEAADTGRAHLVDAVNGGHIGAPVRVALDLRRRCPA